MLLWLKCKLKYQIQWNSCPSFQPGPSGDYSTQQPYNTTDQPAYNQPAYNQPSPPTFNQPTQPAYNQAPQPAYNQPLQPAYDQPTFDPPPSSFNPPAQPTFNPPPAATQQPPVSGVSTPGQSELVSNLSYLSLFLFLMISWLMRMYLHLIIISLNIYNLL